MCRPHQKELGEVRFAGFGEERRAGLVNGYNATGELLSWQKLRRDVFPGEGECLRRHAVRRCGRVMHEWCLSVRRKDRLQAHCRVKVGKSVSRVATTARDMAASTFQLGASNVRQSRLLDASNSPQTRPTLMLV
jgi:hypothetical protein